MEEATVTELQQSHKNLENSDINNRQSGGLQLTCWHKDLNKGNELEEERTSFSKLPLGNIS